MYFILFFFCVLEHQNFACVFLRVFRLLEDFVPQTSYRGSTPGPRWGTSVPQTPWFSPLLVLAMQKSHPGAGRGYT